MKRSSHLLNAATTMAFVWAAHFLVDVMIGFWAVYKTIAGLDLAIAGLIAGLCPFIGEGMQVVFGGLGDKGYRKALLIFGLSACAFCTLLPYTQSYLLLFFIYLITCLGSGAFHPTAVAVASSLTQDRKGLFVTIFASGGALGLALSQLIFTSSYILTGGNMVFLSIPLLLLCLFLLSVQIPGAPHALTPKGKRYGFSAMKKLFRCKELATLYASQVCNQAIFWGVMFLLPDVLMSKGYPSWICLGGGHLFLVLGGAVMMIPGGHLSDKFSPKIVLLTASITGIVFYYVFLATPLIPETWLLLLLFCLGASLGVASPVAVAYGNKMMPSRPGLVSAFLMGLVWCIAEGIGPGGGGLLTKLFVEDAPTKALECLGVLFFTGMVITIFLPKQVEKEIIIENI